MHRTLLGAMPRMARMAGPWTPPARPALRGAERLRGPALPSLRKPVVATWSAPALPALRGPGKPVVAQRLRPLLLGAPQAWEPCGPSAFGAEPCAPSA